MNGARNCEVASEDGLRYLHEYLNGIHSLCSGIPAHCGKVFLLIKQVPRPLCLHVVSFFGVCFILWVLVSLNGEAHVSSCLNKRTMGACLGSSFPHAWRPKAPTTGSPFGCEQVGRTQPGTRSRAGHQWWDVGAAAPCSSGQTRGF